MRPSRNRLLRSSKSILRLSSLQGRSSSALARGGSATPAATPGYPHVATQRQSPTPKDANLGVDSRLHPSPALAVRTWKRVDARQTKLLFRRGGNWRPQSPLPSRAVITLADIKAARDRVAPVIRKTPLERSDS